MRLREQLAQSLRRALGTMLLHEREHAVHDDDDDDRDAELRHPRDERQCPAAQSNSAKKCVN